MRDISTWQPRYLIGALIWINERAVQNSRISEIEVHANRGRDALHALYRIVGHELPMDYIVVRVDLPKFTVGQRFWIQKQYVPVTGLYVADIDLHKVKPEDGRGYMEVEILRIMQRSFDFPANSIQIAVRSVQPQGT